MVRQIVLGMLVVPLNANQDIMAAIGYVTFKGTCVGKERGVTS